MAEIPAPKPDRSTPVPVFGVNRASDFAPRTEQPGWLTIGEGAWMWDGPSWEQSRIRLGRVDKPTRAMIVQKLEPSGKRPALEVVHRYTGKDGEFHESRFWIYPNRNGFEGMRRKPNQTKLKL